MEFDRNRVAKEKLEKVQKSNSSGIAMSYIVNTLEDEEVCSVCGEFNEFTANVSKAVIGENHPPFHEDCRCFATYQIQQESTNQSNSKQEKIEQAQQLKRNNKQQSKNKQSFLKRLFNR